MASPVKTSDQATKIYDHRCNGQPVGKKGGKKGKGKGGY